MRWTADFDSVLLCSAEIKSQSPIFSKKKYNHLPTFFLKIPVRRPATDKNSPLTILKSPVPTYYFLRSSLEIEDLKTKLMTFGSREGGMAA
jgi:hypothetical protein